jgi:16S rRNA (guanine(966)-N(2))-methyltransferase RsmD
VESNLTRETKDRVKESIFNSINDMCLDASVLDLFAGSGSLGIEALSRGAKHVDFVDESLQAMDALRYNVDTLELQKVVDIYHIDYNDFLENHYQKYDIILLDPPYKLNVIDDIIKHIERKRMLNPNGVIICLYGKETTLNEQNGSIIETKTKTIGITKVSFMKWGI